MNWDSTRIVLNWIRLSTLSAWIYTVFPSMLHTLNFTSTQLWSKFTSLPLPDLSCLSHSCTPGFLRMLTWGQWLSPWRLILQAIVLAVRPKLWNRPHILNTACNIVFIIWNSRHYSRYTLVCYNCVERYWPTIAISEVNNGYFKFFIKIKIKFKKTSGFWCSMHQPSSNTCNEKHLRTK